MAADLVARVNHLLAEAADILAQLGVSTMALLVVMALVGAGARLADRHAAPRGRKHRSA